MDRSAAAAGCLCDAAMGLILRTPADAAFSLCVRERAEWRCERCGSQPEKQGLHCAHIMSRGHWSTRFDPQNALALCYGCHRITEQNRELMLIPLVLKVHGELHWDRVFAQAQRPDWRVKKSRKEIAAWYRLKHQGMLEARRRGVVGRIEFAGWDE